MKSFRFSRFPKRSDSSVSPFNLVPVYFADWSEPVVEADGGINLETFERYDEGLFALIDPWPLMAAGDEIIIFWNDQPMLHLKVDSAQVNERLFFYLPTEEIEPGFSTCRYELTRAGETVPDDPSVVLTLFIKLTLPAGEDQQKPYPWHSELDIVGLPVDVIDNGVTKEWAASGVPMIIKRYPDMRVRDVIWVCWGSIFLKPHIVTQAEVDGTDEIVVTASPSDILTAGDSPKLLIKYQIHDEVWNFSEKWSKETTVPVEAGAARLDIAIFEDADGGEIHLDQLDHQPTNLLINIKHNDEFTSGDTIEVNFVGIGRPGTASRTFCKEITVGNPPYIHEVPIPFEFVALFATGTLDGSYILLKQDNSEPLRSKRSFVKVVGNPALLPAPTIEEVIGAILPGDSMAATVRIAYPSLKVGDTINMIWEGKKADGNPYSYEEPYDVSGNDEKAGFVFIYVMSEHILALINGSLKLYYRVYNEDPSDYGLSESDFLRVNVRELPATLPAPEVEEAKEGVIDPTQVYTQAHVLVKPVEWAKGDILTYHWIGVPPYGLTKGSIPITLLTIGQTVRFRVDAHYVTSNIGFSVTVIYTLLHAATGKYSYSAPLRVIIGVPLGRLVPPKVIQAIGDTLDPMDALDGVDIECRYDTMDEKLDLLKLLWIGTPGAGTSEDLQKPAQASGSVFFHLPPSVVGANILGCVSTKYAVQRHQLWTQSEEFLLNVLGFQNPEKDLPTPEVPQAVNAVLDLMEFSGDARALVKPWHFIAKGQIVDLEVEGSTSAGPHTIEIFKAHRVVEEEVSTGLSAPLLRTDVLKLTHGSAATVRCRVIFNGMENEDAAVEFPWLPLTIRTRYDYVTPIITSVQDQQNNEIHEAALTYDKQVKIHGTATRGEKVSVRINDTAQETVEVVAPGTWTMTTGVLAEGLQSITVEALYDAVPPISLPRTFTIGIATRPSITAVNDSIGPVSNNGTTYDGQIAVSVSADPEQSVQLYNGNVAIGALIDLDVNGDGATKLTDLDQARYTLKARAMYGDRLESPEHIFTVKAHNSVTLTSVRHSGGELGQGGTTYDSSVSLTGAFTPHYEVQVYDNGGAKHNARANQGGTWTTSLAIGGGAHAVYVKALTTNQQSNTRNFNRETIPPLSIDASAAYLGGYMVRHTNRAVVNPPPGAFLVRTARGGVPPYRYSTDNPGYLQVDASTGRVIGVRNGGARVIVTDARGSSASYPVSVQNVWYIASYGASRYNLATMTATVNNAGGSFPAISDYNNMRSAYNGDPGGYAFDFHWVSDRHQWGAHWLCRPGDGVVYGSNDNGKVGCIGVLLRT
ncbi:Ig-like domain repeat protein [Pseudomonas atacamensis]|uniref:Ig-like domain repeat protein n=1 Tax=Pseudomonas atacamensis TaxID=2565368 RepID=UPI0037F87478